MMRNLTYIPILLFSMNGFIMKAQNIEISSTYLSRTWFADHQGNRYGKGDFCQYKLEYVQPISVKTNERGQNIVWMASLNGKYARLQNSEEAAIINPDEILNFGVNITHIRPLSFRWSMVATLGMGIYSSPHEICWNSLLANGGLIFFFKITKNFSLGAGVGLTNSYGLPMIAPMAYIQWQTSRKIKFDLNISSGLKFNAYAQFGKRFKLTWKMIELDGMSSVFKENEKSKLYSTMTVSSYLSPSVYFTPKFNMFFDAGVTMARGSKIMEREIKYMFEKQKDEDVRSFRPALHFGVGLRYGF